MEIAAALIIFAGFLLTEHSMVGIVNKLGLIADQLKRIADHLEDPSQSRDTD